MDRTFTNRDFSCGAPGFTRKRPRSEAGFDGVKPERSGRDRSLKSLRELYSAKSLLLLSQGRI